MRTTLTIDDELLQEAERITGVKERKLMGRGIGYVDAHLLASTLLTPGTQLWTLDRKLQSLA
jgi:hypothetical protein